MVLKYVVPGYSFPTLWFGVANVAANAAIMLRYIHDLLGFEDYFANGCQLCRPMGFAKS